MHDDLPAVDPGGGSAGGEGGGINTLTNDPPTAVADGYEVPHDQVLEVEAAGVLANDADPESDQLTAVLVTGPEHGLLLAFNDDGSFSYEPDPLYVGSDSFTYRATDGFGESNVVAVSITVSNANPVAQADVFGVHPNQTATVPAFGVLANDTDADDDYLTANLVAGPSSGTLTFQEDGSFSYTPPALFIGVQAFTYVASDGISTGNTATVQLNVHDVNAPPTAANDFITTAHNAEYFSDHSELLANDADADFDPLTATVVSQPAHGTVTFHGDGTFHYQPNGVFAGDDSFTYKVNDGLADSSAAVVTITVTNEEPAAGDDNYVIGHDQALTVPAPGILANDFDREGDAVTLSLLTAPAHGALTLNADGSFSFVPQAAWSGTDSFTYRLSDGIAQGDAATVWLYVTNTAPLGAPDFYGTPSGQPLSVTRSGLLANDSDLENDSITITVQTGPANGTLSNFSGTGAFTYAPNSGFVGNDTFTYVPTDGVTEGDPVAVVVSVVGSDVITNDDVFVVAADGTLSVPAGSGVLANDFAPLGAGNGGIGGGASSGLMASLTTSTSHGTLTLNANGSLTYVHDAGYSGVDSFSYRAAPSGPGAGTGTGGGGMIIIVSINLRLEGLSESQESHPGGFIPINADNDNGSRVLAFIPAKRDFSVNPMPPGKTDFDLKKVTVEISPSNPLLFPGWFTLDVQQAGAGSISLWDNKHKEHAVLLGSYQYNALPMEFYVEGTEDSLVVKDLILSLVYQAPPGGIVASDAIPLTVTPVLDYLTITPTSLNKPGNVGGVFFRNGADGMAGLQGDVDFRSQLVINNVPGGFAFVQNVLRVENGGLHTYESSITGLHQLDHWMIAKREWKPFPILDLGGMTGKAPKYPTYGGGTENIDGITHVKYKSLDGPTTVYHLESRTRNFGTTRAPSKLMNLQDGLSFTMWATWFFDDGPGILWPLAWRFWRVDFVADRPEGTPDGSSVTRIVSASPGSGITIASQEFWDHSPPHDRNILTYNRLTCVK